MRPTSLPFEAARAINDCTSNRIPCLGSLVIDPMVQINFLAGDWNPDGSMLHAKFARTSDSEKGQLTLVLVSGTRPVPVLWAEMRVPVMAAAGDAQRARVAMKKVWLLGLADPAAMVPELAASPTELINLTHSCQENDHDKEHPYPPSRYFHPCASAIC